MLFIHVMMKMKNSNIEDIDINQESASRKSLKDLTQTHTTIMTIIIMMIITITGGIEMTLVNQVITTVTKSINQKIF